MYESYEDQAPEVQAKGTKDQYKAAQGKTADRVRAAADKLGVAHDHPDVQKRLAFYADPSDGTQADNIAAAQAVDSASGEPNQEWFDNNGEWWYQQERNKMPEGDFTPEVSAQFNESDAQAQGWGTPPF